jgi:hypothetical protein
MVVRPQTETEINEIAEFLDLKNPGLGNVSLDHIQKGSRAFPSFLTPHGSFEGA